MLEITSTTAGSSEQFAVWSTAYMNDLPDSAFLYIEPGGKKDSDGKTQPRSLRHFPYKDATGKVDLAHLRNALARIPQSNLPQSVKDAATAKAKKLLASANSSSLATDNYEFFALDAPLAHTEIRDPSQNPDNTWTMSGYAAVFNQEAVLRKIGDNELRVTIDPKAFRKVLKTQQLASPDGVVHLNLGHDMNRVVASTNVPAGQPGSLILDTDRHGLKFLAKTSRDDPDAQKMAVGMRDGYIAQASMAFATSPDGNEYSEVDDTTYLRKINEINMLMDVCATPQGVFPQTTSRLESYALKYGQPVLYGGRLDQPTMGVEIPISDEPSGRMVKPRLSADELSRIKRHLRRR